jgi:hypothetical protein
VGRLIDGLGFEIVSLTLLFLLVLAKEASLGSFDQSNAL